MKKTWIKNTVVALMALIMVCGVLFVAGEKTALAAAPKFDAVTVKTYGPDAFDLKTKCTSGNAATLTFALTDGGDYISVTADGIVTAKKNGTAKVQVTDSDGGQSMTLSVKVSIPVTLTLPALADMTIGGTQDIAAMTDFVSIPAASSDTLSWSSSNNSVATVDGAGVITARSGGTATITATSKISGTSKSKTVKVTSPSITVARPNPVSIPTIGGTATVTATLKKNGYDMASDVVWTSSDDSVVIISSSDGTADANGYSTATLEAVKAGSATITCRSAADGYNSVRGSTTIVVGSSSGTTSGDGTGITLSTDATTLGRNESATLYISVANPVYTNGESWVKVTRASRRVYLEGYDRHDSTMVYYVLLDGNGQATMTVHSQYNGSVTLTAAATSAKNQSLTYRVTGCPTLPQTGQDYTLIYVLGACCLAAAAAWVVVYAKKKKNYVA